MPKKKTIEYYEEKIRKNNEKLEALSDKQDTLMDKNHQLIKELTDLKVEQGKSDVYEFGLKNSVKGKEYTLTDVLKYTQNNEPIFQHAGIVYTSSYRIYEMPNGTLFDVSGDYGVSNFGMHQAYWNGEYFEYHNRHLDRWEGEPYKIDYDDYYDEEGIDEEIQEINNFKNKMNEVAANILADREIEKQLSE